MSIRTYLELSIFALFFASGMAGAQTELGEALIFQHEDGRTMPYRLLAPLHVEADAQYPLVVFLHGSGERGTNNTIQMQVHIEGLRAATQTEKYASYLIAPQLPSGNTYWSSTQPYDLTMDIINEVAAQHSIDQSQIYVTGLSLGGNGSFNYIAEFPDIFAAAVPMSGWGNPATAATIRRVPVWTFHGDADGTVNVAGSREMYYALDAEGAGPLHTDIQAGSHVIWSPIYSDWETDSHGLYPWLFSQRLPSAANTQLIGTDSRWRFLDDGTDQGTNWQAIDFDDSNWKSGVGQFGYGEEDEETIVNCGPSAPTCREDNFATVYFRRTFQISDPTEIESLTAELIRDDAAAVYLNGVEVFRDTRLPADADFATYAGNTDNSHRGWAIDPSKLFTGPNVIAVEIHQRRATDTDLSFDFRLNAQIMPEPGSALSLIVGLTCFVQRRRPAKRTRLRPLPQ